MEIDIALQLSEIIEFLTFKGGGLARVFGARLLGDRLDALEKEIHRALKNYRSPESEFGASDILETESSVQNIR
jgi:hypothetical protein